VASLSIANNTACVAGDGSVDGNVSLGWPTGVTQGIVLSSLYGYTFSYTVYTLAGSTYIDAKVGSTVPPLYTSDVESVNDLATTTPQTFSHSFSGVSDSSAGIALSFTPDVTTPGVCFSNVFLVQN
jgi:hypothetical protein